MGGESVKVCGGREISDQRVPRKIQLSGERELRDVGVNVSQLQVHVDEETAGESVEDQVSTAISTFRIHLRGNFITE